MAEKNNDNKNSELIEQLKNQLAELQQEKEVESLRAQILELQQEKQRKKEELINSVINNNPVEAHSQKPNAKVLKEANLTGAFVMALLSAICGVATLGGFNIFGIAAVVLGIISLVQVSGKKGQFKVAAFILAIVGLSIAGLSFMFDVVFSLMYIPYYVYY